LDKETWRQFVPLSSGGADFLLFSGYICLFPHFPALSFATFSPFHAFNSLPQIHPQRMEAGCTLPERRPEPRSLLSVKEMC